MRLVNVYVLVVLIAGAMVERCLKAAPAGAPVNTSINPALGTEGSEWVAAPTTGLGLSCRRPAWRRGPDPRRRLDSTPRPDAVELAAACALYSYEQHTATLIRAAALTRRPRLHAQQLFPYGLGPVLGDLMLPTDGGGDMLRALTDVAQGLLRAAGFEASYADATVTDSRCAWPGAGTVTPRGRCGSRGRALSAGRRRVCGWTG